MKKVLIVDDELSIVNFITDVVRVLGFESRHLTDGKKVVATAREWKPNIITLDLMIPSPDGLTLLNQLKADPNTSDISVYIITALKATPELAQKLETAQAVFYKPIDTKEFIGHLRGPASLHS